MVGVVGHIFGADEEQVTVVQFKPGVMGSVNVVPAASAEPAWLATVMV